MVDLEIQIGDNLYAGENLVKKNKINIFLSGFSFRKNISIKTVVKKFNYIFLCEMFCYYGQLHQKDFIKICKGGEYQYNCRIDKLLMFGGITT